MACGYLRIMIKVKDMLRRMEAVDRRGDYLPFSLKAVTADRKRNTGGEIITYDAAVLARPKKKKASRHGAAPARIYNRERNITAPGSGQIRKVHVDLIIEFNGEVVA